MKRSFYYAELDLTVELVHDKGDFLDNLSKNDVQALSLMLHSTITDFLLVRTLFAADAVEYAKRLDNCRPKHNNIVGGG